MKDYLKNEIKHLPFILIVFVLLYGIVTIATSYQYDSGDIRFDNTGTDLESVNVQDALDETFHHVTDYNEIKTTIGNSTLTTTSQTLTGAVNEVNDQIAQHEILGTTTTSLTSLLVSLSNYQQRTYAVESSGISKITDWPSALNNYKFYAVIHAYYRAYRTIDILAIRASDGKPKRISGYLAANNTWIWES